MRSHIRLTTQLNGEHHVTVPDHNPLKIGTFKSVVKLVADHHRISLEALMQKLDL